MIRELADVLGISEHGLYGAIHEACRRGSGDPTKTVTMEWTRDFFEIDTGLMLDKVPAMWSIVMILGPTEQLRFRLTETESTVVISKECLQSGTPE